MKLPPFIQHLVNKSFRRDPLSGEWVYDCPGCGQERTATSILFTKKDGAFEITCYFCRSHQEIRDHEKKRFNEREFQRNLKANIDKQSKLEQDAARYDAWVEEKKRGAEQEKGRKESQASRPD